MLCEMRQGSECEHWRGSKKGAGRVGGRRGREIRRRARVRKRRSTASVEGAELTWQAYNAERERKGASEAMARRLVIRARETERERAGEKNWHRQIGPLGSERGREAAREGELPLTGGVCLSDDAGAWAHDLAGPTWVGWATLSFSFSLNFLIPFPFLFL
jgi:hypothetical protein